MHTQTEVMPQIVVRISDDQMDWLNAQTRPFYTKSDVVRDLIHTATQGIDTSCTLGKPSRETAAEPEEGEVLPSKAVKQVNELVSSSSKKNTRARSPFSSKQLPDDCIPNDVIDCDQLLREWWSVKKGTRSENVFNRVCRKLAAMTPEDRRKALEAAANAGWADVYEPRPTPGQAQRQVGVVSTPPLSSAMQEWMKS